MPSELLIYCHKLLKEQQLTISFAESATGGRLSAEFSLIPECGEVLKGGIVCYDACIKQDVLGVPQEIVERYTPESAEVTKELAERLGQFMALLEYGRTLDATARLARCIASLFNPILYPDLTRHLEITQEEIGALSGISRQNANQCLKRLEKEGLLRLEYGGVTIVDLERLRYYGE